MNYFYSVGSLEELKSVYRTLAMENHPDRGGDVETMKKINLEYEKLFEILKNAHNAKSDQEHQTTETAEEFRDVIEKLLKIGQTIIVELCGSWLWISGETYANREALKAAGCRYSKNKKMWYWHHEEGSRKNYKKSYTMAQIRSKYGSEIYTNDLIDYLSAAC